MTVEHLAAVLGARRCGKGWIAQCPGHKDKRPSLSISERDGKLLVHCFAGCTQDAVIDALHCMGLWPERQRKAWTAADRAAWRKQRKYMEKYLPTALLWRRAVVVLSELELDRLKDSLADNTLPASQYWEIMQWHRLVTHWLKLSDYPLVEAFRHWMRHQPRLTKGMVQVVRKLELNELCRLKQYITTIERRAA